MTTKTPLKYDRNTVHGVNVTLKRNTIDEDALRYFNQGQCHALAYALHKKLDLPMIWLECPFWGYITHCAVELPNGEYIDITGIHDPKDFGYEVHSVPNPQAFIDSCVTGATDDDDLEWATPDMYLAHHFANLIINDHALDIAELMTY